MITLILIILFVLSLFYVHLGWCWVDALMRLDAGKHHQDRNYIHVFLLWPFSMMTWSASQKETDYDDTY